MFGLRPIGSCPCRNLAGDVILVILVSATHPHYAEFRAPNAYWTGPCFPVGERYTVCISLSPMAGWRGKPSKNQGLGV